MLYQGMSRNHQRPVFLSYKKRQCIFFLINYIRILLVCASLEQSIVSVTFKVLKKQDDNWQIEKRIVTFDMYSSEFCVFQSHSHNLFIY